MPAERRIIEGLRVPLDDMDIHVIDPRMFWYIP
jgi:hypothetical protein